MTLEALSSVPRKLELYNRDTYFLEGREVALGCFESADVATEWLRTHTYALVKPETLLTGRLPHLLEWLEAHKIRVEYAKCLQLSRHAIRALWFYHWNAVGQGHRLVVDRLLGANDCLLLTLKSEDGDPLTPARFATLKGPARVVERAPGELRRSLGNYNLLLNFVHSPDEPADLLRELAVLLDSCDLERVLRDGRLDRCIPAIGQIVAPDLNAQALLDQLRETALPESGVHALQDCLLQMDKGGLMEQTARLYGSALDNRCRFLLAALSTYAIVELRRQRPLLTTVRANDCPAPKEVG